MISTHLREENVRNIPRLVILLLQPHNIRLHTRLDHIRLDHRHPLFSHLERQEVQLIFLATRGDAADEAGGEGAGGGGLRDGGEEELHFGGEDSFERGEEEGLGVAFVEELLLLYGGAVTR